MDQQYVHQAQLTLRLQRGVSKCLSAGARAERIVPCGFASPELAIESTLPGIEFVVRSLQVGNMKVKVADARLWQLGSRMPEWQRPAVPRRRCAEAASCKSSRSGSPVPSAATPASL